MNERDARRRLSVLGWTRRGDRLRELADALGGEAKVIFTPALATRSYLVPLRYLTCASIQVVHLLRRRPSVVIVVNPPLWPALIALVHCRLTGAHLVLDSHPGGFGAQGHVVEGRLQWLHRFLVRRAAAVLVSTDEWVDRVRSWGGSALVVHEPLRSLRSSRAPMADRDRPTVFFACIFAPDEPVAEVLDAARRVPDCDWRITGDPDRAGSGVLDDLPPNVELTGYLGPDEYVAALVDADMVLALTTEPTSVMRAAYEAVHARRPLVISDFPVGASTFPHATPTANEGAAIAAAVTSILEEPAVARERTEPAHRVAAQRWARQLADLEALVDQDRSGVPGGRRRRCVGPQAEAAVGSRA